LRGSYITDLFKGVTHPNSKKVKDCLTPALIRKNVAFLLNELADVGVSEETTYVVFGTYSAEIAQMFRKHFLPHMGDVSVEYYYHYAYYALKDRDWVEGFWDKLGIKADYNAIRAKYRSSEATQAKKLDTT
jgi:hypothetical protein